MQVIEGGYYMALYLDDLKVGDTFISEKYHLSTYKIKRFAREFDPKFSIAMRI